MTKTQRLGLTKGLEELRGSTVISYLTADRGIASVPMSEDILRIMYDHLRTIGHVDQIDLMIYSRGGDTMLPWPLVNTIRAYCERFCVLVPFRAHSAATLTALGADEVVMTPLGQLTPVEPTITMPLNPPNPAAPGQQLGLNVEDVATYMQFVEERGGIESEQGRSQALASLTSHVNPVALGHLHRFHRLARQQARKLLELHMDSQAQEAEIDAIVDKLVKTLWAHNYKINRQEAREIGLAVKEASPEEDQAIWNLYEAYEDYMDLRKPILPSSGVFPSGQGSVTMKGIRMALVESHAQADVFVFDLDLTRPPAPTPPGQPAQFGPQVQMTVTRQAWRKA